MGRTSKCTMDGVGVKYRGTLSASTKEEGTVKGNY